MTATYTDTGEPCKLGCLHKQKICACGEKGEFKSYRGHYYCGECYFYKLMGTIRAPRPNNLLEAYVVGVYRYFQAKRWLAGPVGKEKRI